MGIVLSMLTIVSFSVFFGKTGLWLAIPVTELITAVLAIVFVPTEKKPIHSSHIQTESPARTQHLVITVSRQFGSGGSTVGKQLAERLHIPVYDKEVSELTAQTSGYNDDMVAMEENSVPAPYGLFIDNHYVPISHQIFTAQSKALKKLAGKGDCVIADRESRIERIMKNEQISREAALQKINNMIMPGLNTTIIFTNSEWAKMENYYITLNSNKGIDTCVDTLYAYIRSVEND